VVLDTNVRRVIARAWGGQEAPTAHLTGAERDAAARLVPAEPAASVRWNVGAMELGALVCKSRAPLCEECPISSACAWLGAGRPENGARRRPAQAWVGSDRQVRGRILAVLRGDKAPVNLTGHAALEDIEPGQLDRCIEGLVDDGLARLVSHQSGTYLL
jgi:A/G-specific adenine glycosylase